MDELKRSLSIGQGLALAVSLVVGSGVLGLPGIVLENIGPEDAALSWIVTAVSMIPLVIIFSKLGIRFPSSPGLLHYAEFAFGRAGRNGASLLLLSSFVMGLPALVLIGGSFLQGFFGSDPSWVSAYAALLLAFSVGFNLAGLKTTTRFNLISVGTILAFILVVVITNFSFFVEGLNVGRLSLRTPPNFAHLWEGCALIFWAFLGWESLSFGVQEFKDPKRTVPLVFYLSFVMVTLLFWMLAFTNIGAAAQNVAGVVGASGLLVLLEGTFLKPICSLVLLLVIVANINAWVYTGSRMLLAEAIDGLLPRGLNHLSKRGVPSRCLFVCLVVVLICLGLYSFLGLKISSLILLVNQNFIFLFAASIVAYLKIEKSRSRFWVASAATLTCTLFLSGFSFWILVPVVLMGVGFLGALAKR